MNAKHTPGPWTLHGDETPWTCGDCRTALEEGEEFGHTEILFSLQNDEQEPIAYFPWEPLASAERCEELRANAQVMAAAPDLLAAAQTVIARVDHTNIHTTIAEMGDTWNMLRAAIALTRGAE